MVQNFGLPSRAEYSGALESLEAGPGGLPATVRQRNDTQIDCTCAGADATHPRQGSVITNNTVPATLLSPPRPTNLLRAYP